MSSRDRSNHDKPNATPQPSFVGPSSFTSSLFLRSYCLFICHLRSTSHSCHLPLLHNAPLSLISDSFSTCCQSTRANTNASYDLTTQAKAPTPTPESVDTTTISPSTLRHQERWWRQWCRCSGSLHTTKTKALSSLGNRCPSGMRVRAFAN